MKNWFKVDGILVKGIIRGTAYVEHYKLALLQDPCCYCGGPSNTREHVLPRNKGGSDSYSDNVVAACFSCNQKRKSKPLLMFLLKEAKGDCWRGNSDAGELQPGSGTVV